mmetsp:Transcript_26016/g.84003  ORF Transcript_26016/g.84003 Transcript_26016/m.84003 type:complete len:100 (-) Transcript_26016:108-407(-)
MAMMELIPLDEGTKPMVLALMNGEHPDAIRLYARHFGKKPKATSAEINDVRYLGFTLRQHHADVRLRGRCTCRRGDHRGLPPGAGGHGKNCLRGHGRKY